MNSIITGTGMLLALLALTQLVIWAAQHFIRRQDEKRTREFNRVRMIAEGQALLAVARNKRNHRQFDQELWDRR